MSIFLRKANLILLITAIIGFIYLLTNATAVWSTINAILPLSISTSFDCKEVKWCSIGHLCLAQCESRDLRMAVQSAEMDMSTGSISIHGLDLRELPSGKHHDHFPRIFPGVRRVELTDGQLGPFVPFVHRIDHVEMERANFGLWNQQWHAHGTLHNAGASFEGDLGDRTDIEVAVKNCTTSENLPLWLELIAGDDIELTATASQPLRMYTKAFRKDDLIFEIQGMNVLVKAKNSPVKSININEYIYRLGSELELVGIDSADMRAYLQGQSFDITRDSQDKKIKLSGVFLSSLAKTLSSRIKIPGFELRGLNGQMSAEILNQKDHSSDELIIYLRDMQSEFNYLGRTYIPGSQAKVNGYLSLGILEDRIKAEFDIKNYPAELFENLLEEGLVEIQGGYLNGSLAYDSLLPEGDQLKGEFDVSGYRVQEPLSGLRVRDGKADIQLNEQGVQAKLTAYNHFKQPLYSEIESQFNKENNTVIKFHSKNFKLDHLNVYNGQYFATGSLKDINAVLKYKEGVLVDYSANGHPLGLSISDIEEHSLITLQSGYLSHDLSQNLQAQSIKVQSGESQGYISGIFDLGEEKSIQSLDLDLDLEASDLKPALGNMLDIKEASGKIIAKAKVRNSQVNAFEASCRDLKIIKDNFELNHLEGRLVSDQNFAKNHQLHFRDMNFVYGDKSKFDLNGQLTINPNIREILKVDFLENFNGSLKGKLNLGDSIAVLKEKCPQVNLSFKHDCSLPISLTFRPKKVGKEKYIAFDFLSETSELISLDGNSLPGYVAAHGMYNPKDHYFNVDDFETVFNGLNLAGSAKGYLTDYSFEIVTDPLIDLGKIFKDVYGEKIFGIIRGDAKGSHINLFERQSFWNNLELNLKTDPVHSVDVGDLHFNRMNLEYLAKDGVGFSIMTVDDGRYRNLPFEGLNASMRLNNNRLNIDGFSMNTAQGLFNLSGYLNLFNYYGYFEGNAERLSVGDVARGLVGERGFSGIGDFNFGINGRLATILDLDQSAPVSASGSFHLENGHVSKVLDIEKKLNLANLILGGPFALNLNTVLEVLAPKNNGYYRLLDGELLVDNNLVVLTLGRYRGVNELKLNMTGIWNRFNDEAEFNIVGSIPKIPVRVDGFGRKSGALNALTQFSIPKILSNMNVLDKRPRVYTFSLKGHPSNTEEMTTSAGNTFRWLDSSHSRDLPIPSLPDIE